MVILKKRPAPLLRDASVSSPELLSQASSGSDEDPDDDRDDDQDEDNGNGSDDDDGNLQNRPPARQQCRQQQRAASTAVPAMGRPSGAAAGGQQAQAGPRRHLGTGPFALISKPGQFKVGTVVKPFLSEV